jgi:AcrR family transcriptional regulator
MGGRVEDQPRVRADAARNRRAILDATAALLRAHGHESLTMDQVAAAAGVGKGTIFHRFGSKAGLLRALIYEGALALREAVTVGPPPLGPGAPAADRLVAYFDAMSRNVIDGIEVTMAYRDAESDRLAEPIHAFWLQHIGELLGVARPDLDAPVVARLLLSSMGGDLVLALIRTGQSERYRRAVNTLVASVVRGTAE